MRLAYFLNNGLHLPFIFYIQYLLTNDFLLPTYLFLKIFSFNYYHNFSYLYKKPYLARWRHLIRLTDTGHYANMLFYLFPETFLSISHNILFVITIAYFYSTYFLGMKASDELESKYIIKQVQQIFSLINHSLPYIILLYYCAISKRKECPFNNYSLFYTYVWIYTWFLCIYIPWFALTKDPVYSIMSFDTPISKKIIIFLFVNLLAYISNRLGKYIAC